MVNLRSFQLSGLGLFDSFSFFFVSLAGHVYSVFNRWVIQYLIAGVFFFGDGWVMTTDHVTIFECDC